MPIHVAIADDHSTVRLGMKYIVQEWMPESVVHFAEDIPKLLGLLGDEPIHIVVLDINIPGGNNFHVIKMIRDIRTDAKILVFSAYEEQRYALRYLDIGANGYLQKNCEDDEIKEALDTVFRGKKYLSASLRDQLVQNRMNRGAGLTGNPIDRLTDRELEVCQLLITGKGVSEIANALFIHTSTVGTYKNKIYQKLDVRNLKELIDAFNDHNDATQM
ncbi:response regulator transcription factor [Parapedobacter pyrenivorans]|uniref:response regulator transcription factor n=1 Tax=Parapedobacter pyrenivorans TaxID=1305674 RepID=UPI0033426E10